MKFGSSQMFAVIVLALLAGLSFWLKKSVELPEAVRDGKFRHDPDAIAENFEVRVFDDQGRLQQRLRAPFMQHFPDDDSSELRKPLLERFRPDAPALSIRSEYAHVTSKGEVVELRDDVVARRAASAERPELVARMPDLTVRPDDGLAWTASPVEITEAKSWVKGVGMHIDNNLSTFVLQSRVTGLLYSRQVSR
ncbi:MAG: LPS export ABC transporter periplasmic protein LptC [Betaproteobacteria bacterium]|nr:LPS export ABC transporter periplasmic protein LptC [Betaproteobacteria bacterium]